MERLIGLGLAIIVGISIVTGIAYNKHEQALIAKEEHFNNVAKSEAATFVVTQRYADEYEEIYDIQKEFNTTNDPLELQKLNDKLDVIIKELNLDNDEYNEARKEVLDNRGNYEGEVKKWLNLKRKYMNLN